MSEPFHISMPSSEQLIRFIESACESDNIDSKGPMKWDGADQSASLAKDIAAFANSSDGGVIVIGKKEISQGLFDYTGLTEEQACSFDTTKVATWINNRFSPSIRLACHRQEYDNKIFVVITIQEFDDIPAFCVKSFADPSDSRKYILRESTIYIRNQNAESKPIGTVDELRLLIGLATKKRGDDLMKMFNAMLKGKPLLEQLSDSDRFEQELQQIWDDLEINEKNSKNTQGAWRMSFHPGEYNPARWSELQTLEELIRKTSIRFYDNYPAYKKGTHPREWGIANDLYGEIWALTRSGIFLFWKEFRENSEPCQNPNYRGGGEARSPVSAGKWIEFQWNMRNIIEFFMFMSRFVEAYEPGDTITYEINAGPITGRILASCDPRIFMGFGTPEPCRAKIYHAKMALSVEELRSNWEHYCAKTMKDFFDLFPDHQISLEILLQWIEKFKQRDF